jgi:hypothetical protein
MLRRSLSRFALPSNRLAEADLKAERTRPGTAPHSSTTTEASSGAPNAAPRERQISGSLRSRAAAGMTTAMSPRQQVLEPLMRGGMRLNPRAVQQANDEALAAGVAASLAHEPPTDARSELQARLERAREAGIPVSAGAMRRADDAALAAGIAASLGTTSPPAPQEFEPWPTSRPMLAASASTEMPFSKPAGEAEAAPRPAGPAMKDPYATLGVRKDAPWRVLFGMKGRLPPAVVKSRATTAEGVAGMMAEVAQAQKDLAKAYKKRLIPIHPDKNLGEDMTPVLDVVNIGLQAGERELASAERFLANRLRQLTPSA